MTLCEVDRIEGTEGAAEAIDQGYPEPGVGFELGEFVWVDDVAEVAGDHG